jgi:hypothetical protein
VGHDYAQERIVMPETKETWKTRVTFFIIKHLLGIMLGIVFIFLFINVAAHVGEANVSASKSLREVTAARKEIRNLRDKVRLQQKKIGKISLTIHMVEEACRLEKTNRKELRKQQSSIRMLWDQLGDIYMEAVCHGK